MFDKHPEAECMDIFDCWIYIVKNMNMFEQMPFSEKYPVFRKLAEIGDLRKLSREELELYDEDIKNMRDIYATRKFSASFCYFNHFIQLLQPFHSANAAILFSQRSHFIQPTKLTLPPSEVVSLTQRSRILNPAKSNP